jgi:hypothetical protein
MFKSLFRRSHALNSAASADSDSRRASATARRSVANAVEETSITVELPSLRRSLRRRQGRRASDVDTTSMRDLRLLNEGRPSSGALMQSERVRARFPDRDWKKSDMKK